MTIPSTLFLHHEIMLLALRPKRGTVVRGTAYPYAVGGAVMAELLLNGRIAVQQSGKKQVVEAVSTDPLGEPLVDRCLERINSEKGRLSLAMWIARLAGVKDLNDRIAEQLCKRDILRAAHARILLIFRRRIYPEADPEPRREVVERLRGAIFTEAPHVDPRTLILLSVADSAGLLTAVFDKNKLGGRKARIEQLVDGEILGKAVRAAVKTMRTAIVAP
ncbi:MAG: GPP34 family phosphoprotein [Phycisphaerales bacterium]|nr:MAG: GPP34 family phosphoprotein [Phycisphaerales bacterium]